MDKRCTVCGVPMSRWTKREICKPCWPKKPKKPKQLKRPIQFKVYLLPEENASMRAAALADGLTPQDYARKMLLAKSEGEI